MDPTRISIARILALDVSLTWQDAVAVAQEAAMLSDVTAAMNSRPSLVSPETCFITRAGDLELSETTDVESPEAVADLLRAMLGDSEVPEALEALAYGPSTRDLSADLGAFAIGNRRAVIARLATRALAVLAAPPARVEPFSVAATGHAAASPPAADATWPPPAERAPAPLPFPSPATHIPPPFVATPRPVVVQAPPFTSAPTPKATAAQPLSPAASDASADRPLGAAPPAPDAELRRLRSLTVERERRNQRWSARLKRWVLWRPAFPDPRLLGGAAVAIAALVSLLLRDAPDGNGTAPGAIDAVAAPTAAPALPVTPATGTSAPAGASAADAPAATAERDTSGRPRAPRPAVAVAPPSGVSGGPPAPPVNDERRATDGPIGASPPAPNATPVTGLPSAPPTTASSAPATEPRRPAPPAAGGRGARGRATYSANDAEVAPPVMLRQQLPSSFLEPDSEVPDDWPYLELLIDEQGAVERVRLRARSLAPGQTLYRHRMLLAAAKAWQFEPAHLNGQAVRYVMRVPLEP